MTTQRDPDEILSAWTEDGPSRLPDQTRRAISVAIRTTPQRRHAIGVPWRFTTMSTTFRLIIGTAAVVAVILGGAFVVGRPSSTSSVGAGPTPTLAPTAIPSPSPLATPAPSSFTSSAFKIPIEFTLSDGWSIATDEQGVVGLQLGDAAASIMSIDSTTVRGVTTTAPWVRWPDDIHAWLAGRPEFKPDATRTAVVGGHPAVIEEADYVREKITDQGDWIKYGTGYSEGLNMSGSWPGRVHIVVVRTGPTSGIVVMMDGPVDTFGAASASLDRLLATLTFR